ncbi:MAG TPA: TonB-dependent receptor [Bryobacteraceae bacterium]|nr:TonB-dependent receptor [Bryobacteraceae bacterium]
MRKILSQLTCILLFSAVAVWGQETAGGTLSGKVTSAVGAAVPNAAVTVTNVNTNASQKVLTGPDGSFTITGLPSGTYRVDVETAGFKRTSQQNVELTTTGPATVNVTLEPGNVNESVEIKGNSPATQDFNGQVGIGIGTRPVRELPVIDRNHQQLAEMQTGITPPAPAFSLSVDPDRNRFFATDGQAPYLNQHYLEGLSNQEPQRATAIRVVPDEAVEQMSIATANLTMDKGFAGGAFLTTDTRAGSNGWHGSLFEYWSGDLLRTRNFFDNLDTNSPRFTMNQFGATAGGAIVPDKTFFFGSYEGMYQRGDQTNISTVPVAGAIGGNFSAIPGVTLYNPFTGNNGVGRSLFAGGIIPSGQINPTAAAIASFIPAPNQPGFVNNYVSNLPYQDDYQKLDARVDQHFSDRTSAFLRYGYSNNHVLNPSPLGDVIGAGTRDRLIGQNAALDLTHAFGSQLITDFRFGYNRYDQHLDPLSNASPLAGLLGSTGFTNGLIGVNIPGMPLIGTPGYLPEHAVDNTFNWNWSWGYHTSTQNIKAGVDVRRIRSDGFTDSLLGGMFGPAGTAYFGPGATLLNNGQALSSNAEFYNSFAAFLTGAPSQVGVANFLTTPTIRQTEYGLWLGDTVQVLRRVTLDLGVRYEVYSPLEARNPGGSAVFNPAANSFQFPGIGGLAMHSSMYDLNNIAPRIGLAFHVSDKTVIRGGYGIQYFQLPYMFSGFLAPMTGSAAGVLGNYSVAPFTGSFGPTVSATVPPPGVLQNGASAGNLPAAVVPHHLETPYIQTFSLQLQRDFVYGTMLSLGYVGTLGRQLQSISELNAALPGAGVAGLPYAAMGRTASTLFYNTGLTDNYNSLQVSLTRRFAHGLAFQGAYTFSKALGYTTGNNMLLDPFNLRANYGPMDYDRQHVLTFSHLWELPFGRHGKNFVDTILGGWQLNGIFTWATGTPLTITADPLLCNCANVPVLASANGPIGTTGSYGIGQPFITGNFFAPAGANVGNLSRGALRGPDMANYDMSLFKNFRIRDRFNFQVRGEAYNLLNRTNLMNPVTNINSAGFGQITGTLNDSYGYGAFGRQVNVGVRVLF